jgi:DNA-binding beta-propeller fold protein YncE
MSLHLLGHIDLPASLGQGGFDHAAIHRVARKLYVAHTANDAVDVIDLDAGLYAYSIGLLKGVAGALVHEASDLLFTSNRGENTVAAFSAISGEPLSRIAVGARPNGLAYDPERGTLLCANVGDPGIAVPPSVTLVDTRSQTVIADIVMPGRTRWAIYDAEQRVFFVNIADPPQIVVIDPSQREPIANRIQVPFRGPHGLELDPQRRRLYCACDEGCLASLDSRSGELLGALPPSGAPDVVFLNQALGHFYVAIGDPGVIDVIDVASWVKVETTTTELGAHTIAMDDSANRTYAFLPGTHRASVYEDRP